MTIDNAIQNDESSQKEAKPSLSIRDQLLSAQKEISARESAQIEESIKPEKVKVAANDKSVGPENADEKVDIQKVAVESQPSNEKPAPSSWKKEIAEKWKEIPSEVRDYISKREADVHRAITAQDELKAAGKTIREVLTPYADLLRETPGVHPAQLISTFFDFERTRRHGSPEQKAQLMANLINSTKIDYGLLNDALEGKIPTHRPDPKVIELEQQLQTVQQFMQQQAESERQRQEQGKVSIVEKFLDDNKLDLDSLDDEFLDHVEIVRRKNPSMSERQVLDTAYSRLHRTVDNSQSIEQRQRLQKAKTAGLSVTGSPGMPGTVAQGPIVDDLRGDLMRNLQKLGGRV